MVELRPSQIKGVEFLLRREPAINYKPHRYLAWDMGTGKTVVSAAAIKQIPSADTAFILCPNSVRETWAHTLVEWGTFKAKDIQIIEEGTDRFRRPVIICGYPLAIKDAIYKQFTEDTNKKGKNHPKFAVGILDEAQRMAALRSQSSKRILGTTYGRPIIAAAYHKWWLSGTPTPNGRPIELFPTLKVAVPELLGRFANYHEFGDYFGGGDRETGYRGASNLEKLWERLKPFMSIVKLEDIAPELPPIVYENAYFDIGNSDMDETNTPLSTLRLEVGDRKFSFVLEYLRERLDSDDRKLLVFTYNREFTKRLAYELGCDCIYGGTDNNERKRIIDRFRSTNRVLVAQRSTIGTGYDGLQRFCHCVVDAQPDWVPDDQEVKRLHRIGQPYPVLVTRLLAEDTLEMPIAAVAQNKKRNKKQLIRSNQMSDGLFERAVIALESIAKSLASEAVAVIEAVAEEKAANGKADKKAAEKAVKEVKATKKAEKAKTTIEHVRQKLTDLATACGEGDDADAKAHEIGIELLGQFGVKRTADLEEDQYDDFIAATEEAIEGLEKPAKKKKASVADI